MSIKAIDGLPVFDAKRPIKLIITKNDIDKADPKEPADCAVARACRRALHAKEARVHLGRVYLRSNAGNWVRYLTPRPLRQEIIAFDRGGTFSPGEFHLGAVTPTKKSGVKRKRGPHLKAGKKRRKAHVVTDVRLGPS